MDIGHKRGAWQIVAAVTLSAALSVSALARYRPQVRGFMWGV
jgi:hypothetical protein